MARNARSSSPSPADRTAHRRRLLAIAACAVVALSLGGYALWSGLEQGDRLASVVAAISGILGLAITVHDRRAQRTPDSPPVPKAIVYGDLPRGPLGHQPRDHIQRALRDAWPATGNDPVVTVLTGIPGTGKTMAAAAYARARQAEGWRLVVWLSAQSAEQIQTGLSALAHHLGLPRDGEEATVSAARARQWMTSFDGPGVLVFDNAEAPAEVTPWFPSTGRLHIVVATRNRAFDRVHPCVEVGVFTPEEAARFLRERTLLDQAGEASELAAELGHLPLALGQAGAVIRQLRIGYGRYRELLRGSALRSRLPAVDGEGHQDSVVDTILVSVDRAEQVDPDARALLEVIALLSLGGVPRNLFTVAIGAAGDRLDDTFAVLADASLITFSQDNETVLMHRFVQLVLRERAQRRMPQVLRHTIGLLRGFHRHLARVPVTWRTRPEFEALAQQVSTVYGVARSHGFTDPVLARLCAVAGGYLLQLAEPTRAAALLEPALADQERLLGADDQITLITRNDLAEAHRMRGRFDRAVDLFSATLEARERTLGPDHLETLISYNNLAGVERARGNPHRAIALLENALTRLRATVGDEHEYTLVSLGNMAGALRESGQEAEAILLFEGTLAEQERLLGGEHPHTLSTRGSLGTAVASRRHRSGEALALLEKTAEAQARVLGENHPETLAGRARLAGVLRDAGREREAIAILRAIVPIQEALLGDTHPDTLATRSGLASALRAAGRMRQALDLHQRTLAGREETFGPDHPLTTSSRGSVARTLWKLGRERESLLMYERALADAERVLGPDHRDTVAIKARFERARLPRNSRFARWLAARRYHLPQPRL
ncbi:tetratricopeptide repeat protein [Nonomuraea typhae]|uniref:tetratricopeptide repeat protein n=1 Tax=Nonomuraea typhae TaxID=2603600 RepID=UPI0012F8DAAB|nr:tetratricopeptide repeat protein [Nonomuraea typhae]